MNWRFASFTGRAGLLASAWTAALFAAGPVNGQSPPALVPPAPAQFDPSDVYFQAYQLQSEGDRLRGEGQFSKSMEKYQQAQKMVGRIQTYFPTWKKDMVERRLKTNQTTMDEIAPDAIKEQNREKASVAELEGQRAEAAPGDLSSPDRNAAGAPDTLATRHIADLENKVNDLQLKLREGMSAQRNAEADESSRDQSRMNDISRQNDLLQSQLKQANDELMRQRSSFNQPLKEDLDRLNGKIQGLEGENKGLQSALAKSQREIDALQKERSSLMQKQADLNQALELQRNAANEVAEGQQKQIRLLQENLRSKQAEVDEANGKIARLEKQVGEMAQSFKELNEENESLKQEREQMSALLKLNENGQLKDLIDQNIGLAKQLREANEKFDRVAKDNDEKTDDYLDSLRDLAVAKSTIYNLQREKANLEKRTRDLEMRLKAEDRNLSENGTGDAQETETLRKVVQRQMRQMIRLRESREVFMQALGEQAKSNPDIASAMELFNGAETPLSAEEMSAINGQRGSDGTIISGVKSKSEVEISTAQLEQQNTPYKKAAQRAFTNERLDSARELLELVTEANPGDIQAICSLGVINLRRIGSPGSAAAAVENFKRAVELDPHNPFAQRMLGKSLVKAAQGNPTGWNNTELEAENAFKKAVELAPTNADNRLSLGVFYFDIGREKEAEEELKTAITCDSTLREPYYDLAILSAHQGKKKRGLEYYNEYRQRDGVEDANLLKQLSGEESPKSDVQ